MKKIMLIAIVIILTVSFASCKAETPYVVSADEKTYEAILTNDGERALNATGKLIVAEKDENGNRALKNLSGKYLIVAKEKIMGTAFDVIIPDTFSISSTQNADIYLISKKQKIQFDIMDKTESVDNFDSFITDVYTSLKAKSENISEIENIVIEGTDTERFYSTIKNDEGQQVIYYNYVLKANNRILQIMLTVSGDTIQIPETADEFIAKNLDFIN